MAFVFTVPCSKSSQRSAVGFSSHNVSLSISTPAQVKTSRLAHESISSSQNGVFAPSENISSRRGGFYSGSRLFVPSAPSLPHCDVIKAVQTPSKEASSSAVSAPAPPAVSNARPKVVILGTGWAALPFVKAIDDRLYDVIMVSPRNYFLFTPLLAGTCVGTLESRSIIEPIRRYKEKITYFEAAATSINLDRKLVYCTNERQQHCFALDYDELIIAVGATSSTFGIPGVEEYTLYLKEISHAQAIRQRIIECFESASFPDITEEDRKRVLHFIIVGGGPTGVEFAAELYDFVREDVQKLFPTLVDIVQITLLQSGSKLLSAFDDVLGDYAIKQFKRQGINVRTNSAVTKVTDREVYLKDGTQIPYGLVVWSAGNGPRQLVRDLMTSIGRRGVFPVAASGGRAEGSRLLTDGQLRVKGVEHLYAIGDCATIEGDPLPPTAQVAQQEGSYLAKAFNQRSRFGEEFEPKPFKYTHLGTLAYIGGNKALADKPLDLPIYLSGALTWLFWRSVYVSKLFSMKSRFLVAIDWFRAGLFGRDVSGIMGDAYDVQRRSRKFELGGGTASDDTNNSEA